MKRVDWRSKPWFEIAALGAVVALLVALAFPSRAQPSILLLDQPRENQPNADFVLRFLRTTKTPHAFEEGFVALPKTDQTLRRLLQLYTGLNQAITVSSPNPPSAASDATDPLPKLLAQRTTIIEAIRHFDHVAGAQTDIIANASNLRPRDATPFPRVPPTPNPVQTATQANSPMADDDVYELTEIDSDEVIRK